MTSAEVRVLRLKNQIESYVAAKDSLSKEAYIEAERDAWRTYAVFMEERINVLIAANPVECDLARLDIEKARELVARELK